MNVLGLRRIPCLARQYSTILPDGAQVARSASTPLAVKERRSKKLGALEPLETDANADGVSPSELQRYNRLRAIGGIPLVNGEPIPATTWASRLHGRRMRLRGFAKGKAEDGTKIVQAVGQKVYLPNIIFKLVRNTTPAGQPYNPYEATFRLPKSVTKTDIRSYLSAVYGVKTTYVRTDNYYAPDRANKREPSAHKSYKRAVVGLVEPFYYPHRTEDMPAEAKAKREEWLENEFAIERVKRDRREEILRQTIGHRSAAFRFHPESATRRSHILKLVTERKFQRENLIAGFAEEIQEKRAEGAEFSYKSLAAKTSPPALEGSKSS